MKGVHYDKANGKYRASICINGVKKSLGYHSSEEEAIRERKEAEYLYKKYYKTIPFGLLHLYKRFYKDDLKITPYQKAIILNLSHHYLDEGREDKGEMFQTYVCRMLKKIDEQNLLQGYSNKDNKDNKDNEINKNDQISDILFKDFSKMTRDFLNGFSLQQIAKNYKKNIYSVKQEISNEIFDFMVAFDLKNSKSDFSVFRLF